MTDRTEELARVIGDVTIGKTNIVQDAQLSEGEVNTLARAILTSPVIAEIERDAEARVVEWLRRENSLCDCFAREANECGCGAWDDYKMLPVERVADAIEAGEHRSE